MHRTAFEIMRDHVRDIYHALTGRDIPEGEAPAPRAPSPGEGVSADVVLRLFADLEAAARSIPAVSERVPPFSFAPPLDVLEDERELIIEVAVPGVETADVKVELSGDKLSVTGIRGGIEPNGHWFKHAEIARGPFRRMVLLPQPVAGGPRVKVEQGIISIRLAKAQAAEGAKA